MNCYIPGCGHEVKPAQLMCLRHWQLVPIGIQHQVFRARRRRDRNPRAYQIAIDAARQAVTRAEQHRLDQRLVFRAE